MKLIILDYTSGIPTHYNLGDDVANWESEDYEEFMVSEGFRLKDIHWMTTKENINYEN
jgi:hypothetical protein